MTDPTLRDLREQLAGGAARYRRRRRNITAVGSVVLAVVVGLAAYAVAAGDDEDDVRVRTQPTDPSPSSTTDPPPTTSTTPTTSATSTTAPRASGPMLEPGDARAASMLVNEFVTDLRFRDDVSAAAERWTGYPEVFGPDVSVSERIPYIEDLMEDPDIARTINDPDWIHITASWGFTTAMPVATVLAEGGPDAPPTAIAFLLGRSEEMGDPDRLWIHRLPSRGPDRVEPAPGSEIDAGQTIVIEGIPTEGGARAHVDGIEVPVEVDYENLRMRVTIPDDATGDIAVTISTATPELPGVAAYAYTIR